MTVRRHPLLGTGAAVSLGVAFVVALVLDPTVAPFVAAVGLCATTVLIGAANVRREGSGLAPSRARVASSQRQMAAPLVAVTAEVFTRAKLGAASDENEDAATVSDDHRVLAVADGASSAFASRQWSRALTDGYVARGGSLGAADRAEFVSAQSVAWQEAMEPAGDTPWWEDAARQQGSFAAFLGVTIDRRGRWHAEAVGDCCLIVVRDGRIETSFPIESAGDFTSTPSLLATGMPDGGQWVQRSGRVAPGDLLVLASDGLAEWLLADPRARAGSLLDGEDALATLVDAEREAKRMENDDITMVAVRVEATSAP